MIAYQPVLDTIISSGYSGVKYEIEKEISIRTPTNFDPTTLRFELTNTSNFTCYS